MRRIGVFASAAALLLIVWGFACADRRRGVEKLGPERLPADRQTTSDPGPRIELGSALNCRNAAESLVQRADELLVGSGISADRAAALRPILVEVLHAQFASDFDTCAALQQRLGGRLDDTAASFAEYVDTSTIDALSALVAHEPTKPGLLRRFSAADAASLSGAPIRDRIAFMWNHPAERLIVWEAIHPESLRCGTGLHNVATDPDLGGNVFLQLTLFAPTSGRPKEAEVERLDRSPDSAWIQFFADLSPGGLVPVRFIFYFDGGSQKWIPYFIAVKVFDKPIRPLPML